VVDPRKELDDDAFDPQVVAPDALNELGVVAALDEDAARQGYPRASILDSEGTGRGSLRSRGGRRDGFDELDPGAVDEEAPAERERSDGAVAIFEVHESAAPGDHGAGESARRVLDDEVGFDWHARCRGDSSLHPEVREDVVAVSVVSHRSMLTADP
jgi:hypothetical protein